MISDELDVIRENTYHYWKKDDYGGAISYLRPLIKSLRSKKDFDDWSRCIGLLYRTYLLSGRANDAENLLIRSVKSHPNSYFLFELLSLHYWKEMNRPDLAIKVLESFDVHQGLGDAQDDIVQLNNLLARLHTATDNPDAAIKCIKSVLDHLPQFSPPRGYLFDFEAILEMYQARILHPVMKDYINRIENPRYLIIHVPDGLFTQLKSFLNQLFPS
jgi:hypothetical protein